ncbi:3-hydroxyacyl-CoA dehydrogenase NAD-binding domain-containing protein [Dietzia timorensis]|uniref:Fatty acid oxidation complex subunit alpha n=1 Tax=Dietzia timorensis TaxID=499555 RepID=A0A173LJ18_9ACTN|nr:3-hydroxyacyl-CoA dehydrogenase NAD-binding domain-containing protein [Dietzia timorensis]ANI91267.1 Fatty acid oxidation complex subunit alpha [Dietzia timorensis]
MSEQAVRYEIDAEGIATIWLDDPISSANTMNADYIESMETVISDLENDCGNDKAKGVVIASAKKTFFAGGDLEVLHTLTPDQAGEAFSMVEKVKNQLRRLETCGVPVVAAINGTALGGGLEIALAAHRRIAVNDRNLKLGLPEVSLGLLPGGGGITRLVRMFGIQSALMDWLLQGQQRNPEAALKKWLVDKLVDSPDQLLPAAHAWLKGNAEGPESHLQPWDRDGYKIPGGTPASPELAAILPSFPANLRKQLKGADFPAPRAIMAVAVEGAQVDFDTASRIESRYFAKLVVGHNAKDMTKAFFFDLQSIGSDDLRPASVDKFSAKRVGVLGAGMMGAGIAYACATRGVDVILKDVSAENAEQGKAYTQTLLEKKVSKGRMTEEARDEILARINATEDASSLADCDVIIEAVFENAELKGKVFAEIEEVVGADALLCSNTSTLPITDLASRTKRPADFIGMHFFSPVDKMKLVELIVGEETSPATLAHAIDVVQQIGKLPIVVNDSRGFFTSRVFGTYVLEGAAMVEEGLDPVVVDRAGTKAGFPSGPLTLLDEVTLSLPRHVAEEARKAAESEGTVAPETPGLSVLDKMVDDYGREGRAAGKGFYEYQDGARTRMWPELRTIFAPEVPAQVSAEDIADRFLFAMAIDTARCFENNVITSSAAANIGSIFGIGFPPNRGGAAQFVENYPGGMGEFVKRADVLADTYGERFRPSEWLRERAVAGQGLGS